MRAVDALGDTSTLVAVLLGGIAATLGSFAAVSFERFVSRREAERDAALMFGEFFHTFSRYVGLVRDAHGRGDPFGPITIRMLKAVRREVEIYVRNRERLLLVRDGALRIRVVNLMGQADFAIDRMLDVTDALDSEKDPGRRAELAEGREQAFGFLLACAEDLPGCVAQFASIAKVTFGGFDPLPGAVGPLEG